MLDSKLEDRYKELEKPIKRYLKYNKLSNWLLYSALVSYAGMFLTLMIKAYFFGGIWYSSEAIIIILLVMAYFAIAVFAAIFVARKAVVYLPDADDWMLYHTCSTLESLEDYHKSKISALKEEHRKKAVKNAKEVLSTVRENWTLGDFRLAKNIFGDTISNISDNLRNRVVPSLERGDDETLKKVEFTLYQLAQYLLHPTAEMLQNVNKSMSENLDFYETTKLGFIVWCSSFFTTHAILKHATIVGLIFAAGFIPALLGLYFGHSSIDTALLVFTGISGPSFAVYLAYVLKKL